MKKAVLLDVSAIMYRAFYSLMNLRNSKKEPTGAVLGFTNTLLKVIEVFEPDYIAAAFDVKKETLKRKEEYAEYKENRQAMPEDLAAQIKNIEKVLDLFNVSKYKIDGYEADDVLGTLARKLESEGVEVYIVTGDKDLSQILSRKVKIALPGKSLEEKFRIIETPDDVIEQLGVYPEQIPDLFGLQGDSSDGIPGVKGVGPKTAIKLIQEYNTLENIYDNIDKITGKLKERLIEDKELAFISRKLAIIETQVPLEFSLEKTEKREERREELALFFGEMEFKSLIKKMKLDEVKKTPETSGGLFGQQIAEEKKEKRNNEFKLTIIKSTEEMEVLINEKELAIFFTNAGAAFSNGENTWYVPINHSYLGAYNVDMLPLKKLFESDIKFIGYDFKNLLLKKYDVKNPYFDVMLGYYLLNPDENYNLEKMIMRREGEEVREYKEVFGKTEEVHTEIKTMGEYAGKRAWHIAVMKEEIEKEIKENGLEKVFFDIEMKLIKVLSAMEKLGIKVDANYFYRYGEELGFKISVLEEEIYREAGGKFNINSPKQLSEILFVRMGIMPDKKTKTGFSTDVEVLESLSERGVKIADSLLEYRQFVKLKSTYVDALPKLIDGNGRIHTTFNQNGAATGRLSSSDPNLQNIPVKTDEGIKIRKGFISEKGWSLVSFDYSQIELRVLGEITKDKELVRAYNDSIDLHALTASKIFNRAIDEITREERIVAKIVNFSIIYGKTPFGLAKEIHITPGEAKEYIEKYFEQYKGVREFIDNTVSEAEKSGYVRTLFDRKRAIEGIDSRNKNLKHAGDRMAVNTIVQGTAADILKIVMIKIAEKIKGMEDVRLLLQVHDELVFEIKDEKIDEVVPVIKEIMENSIDFKNIKLEVNYKVGKSWDETK